MTAYFCKNDVAYGEHIMHLPAKILTASTRGCHRFDLIVIRFILRVFHIVNEIDDITTEQAVAL